MTSTLRTLAVLLAVVAAVPRIGSAEDDKKIGKWKLRVDPPAHGTREYEDRGGGVTVSTRQGINARGQEYYSSYAAKVDGKEYPRLVKGSTTINTIAFTRVDAHTVAYTLREDGRITSTGTTTVSDDGKVLTVTTKSVNAAGAARAAGPAGAPARGNAEIYDRIQ